MICMYVCECMFVVHVHMQMYNQLLFYTTGSEVEDDDEDDDDQDSIDYIDSDDGAAQSKKVRPFSFSHLKELILFTMGITTFCVN